MIEVVGAKSRLVGGRLQVEIDLKGDLPGHPFRGNQWSGGGASGNPFSDDESEYSAEEKSRLIGLRNDALEEMKSADPKSLKNFDRAKSKEQRERFENERPLDLMAEYQARCEKYAQEKVPNGDSRSYREVIKEFGQDPFDAPRPTEKPVDVLKRILGGGSNSVSPIEGANQKTRDATGKINDLIPPGGPKVGPGIKYEQHQGGHATASKDSRTLKVAQDRPVRSYAHEIGHFVEFDNPGVEAAAKAFMAEHGTGVTIKNREVRITGFGEEYAGRFYRRGGPTEVISVGLENMIADPVGFARRDPAHFDFMLAVLRGDFNRASSARRRKR